MFLSWSTAGPNPDCQFIKTIIKGAPPAEQAPSPVLKTLTTSDSAGAANKPDFSDVQVRLKSFKKLSPAFPISRQQLSETGLYLLRTPRCDEVLQMCSSGPELGGGRHSRGETQISQPSLLLPGREVSPPSSTHHLQKLTPMTSQHLSTTSSNWR